MPRIWIIGGANIDLCGKAVHKLRVHDSNIGHIELRYGGVGRNIAQICCLLKERVNFVSCFSTDDFGKALMKDCEDLGMHLEYSYTTNAYPSSLYIALLDEGGDMYMGMNDMRILESLPFERIQEVCSLVKEDDILVIDGNLEEEVAQYIVGHCKGKIVADPVSIVKAKRLTKVLPYLSIYKPNRYEAKDFTGIDIVDEDSAYQSLKFYRDLGIEEVLISLAEDGVLLAYEDKKIWYKHRQIDVKNATGGGDSFLGAYLVERLNGKNPQEAIYSAMAAAVVTIEKDVVYSRQLTRELIEETKKILEVKEFIL